MRRLIASYLLVLCALLNAPLSAQAQETETGWLSRVTIAAPVFTRHTPNNSSFNNNNWGGFVFVRLDDDWYAAGGYYNNSYDKDTAFASVAWLPLHLGGERLHAEAGGMVGVDLNGGYKNYNNLHPLLGALNVKLSGRYFDDPQLAFFNRLGLLMTVIPGAGTGSSTAINLAVTLQL